MSERPPPEPRTTPITFGRPGSGSSSSISRPALPSQLATKRAISASPGPSGTRSGLTELMATSCRKSSVVSLILPLLSGLLQDRHGTRPRVPLAGTLGRVLSFPRQAVTRGTPPLYFYLYRCYPPSSPNGVSRHPHSPPRHTR